MDNVLVRVSTIIDSPVDWTGSG